MSGQPASVVSRGAAPSKRAPSVRAGAAPAFVGVTQPTAAGPSLRVWCLERGSRVATATAELPVDGLTPGTPILTASGRTAPVFGIERLRGVYRVDAAARPGLPLRVRAHALADGSPHRDTVLLADQAIRLGDGDILRLVDVIDGANVARVDLATVEWVCIALATDQPLIVNGLMTIGYPVEQAAAGHPADVLWSEQAAARVAHTAFGGANLHDIASGGRWAVLRARLAERGRAAGLTTIADPAVQLRADERPPIWPEVEGCRCRFALPPGLDRVTLASRSGVPARYLGPGDERRLGIAVSGLQIGRRVLPLAHWALRDGWHDAESTWRWTDGAATILLPHRAAELTVTIANPLRAYPL